MTQRAERLEAALDDAIAYLEAWPPHPATTAKLRELRDAKDQAARDEDPAERAMVGEVFTSLGAPVVRAELLGSELHLWSGLDRVHAWEMYRRLAHQEGLRVTLRQLQGDEPHTRQEKVERQRAQGFTPDPPDPPSAARRQQEVDALREQLAPALASLRATFAESARLCLALAALEGIEGDAQLALFAAMREGLQGLLDGLDRVGAYDDAVSDTLEWLAGELDEVLGAPQQRWHLDRM